MSEVGTTPARVSTPAWLELFTGLFDDASQFPPGNMPLDEALVAHKAWKQDPRSAFVGMFLLPIGRADAFEAERQKDDADPISVSLIVKGTSWSDGTALATNVAERLHAPSSGVHVDAAELPLPDAFDTQALDALRSRSPKLEIYVEPVGQDVQEILPRIAESGLRAKLRCGGLEASAFPSVEQVSEFIATCAELKLPFKATAGLHEPIAHYDATIGARHHGFLNLWAATACALEAPSEERRIRACLELEDAADVVLSENAVRFGEVELPLTAMLHARDFFTAFGTCSIAEPLEGLESMGWLQATTLKA
jgi:hypothetical protein